MRHLIHVAFISALFLASSVNAQSTQKQDSLLTTWANDLARYSRYSCTGVVQKVRDSAVHVAATFNSYRHTTIRSSDGSEYVTPMDSAGVAFIVQERIKKELLK